MHRVFANKLRRTAHKIQLGVITMNTLMNCGCVIKVYDDGSGVDIEYCNLHWAAQDLLIATHRLAALQTQVGRRFPSTEDIEIAKIAIAKAERK